VWEREVQSSIRKPAAADGPGQVAVCWAQDGAGLGAVVLTEDMATNAVFVNVDGGQHATPGTGASAAAVGMFEALVSRLLARADEAGFTDIRIAGARRRSETQPAADCSNTLARRPSRTDSVYEEWSLARGHRGRRPTPERGGAS